MAEQGPADQQKPNASRLPKFLQRSFAKDPSKIGSQSLGAWFRLGLEELRQAVSLDSNIVQPTPYGMFGAQLTPGEVASGRREAPDIPQVAAPATAQQQQEPSAPAQAAQATEVDPLDAARAEMQTQIDEQEKSKGKDRGISL